jgi:predicted Zn finger-like uncharacterized protein
MIVTCGSCQTRFKVAPGSLGPNGARVRCSRCRAVFTVGHEGSSPGVSAPAAAPAARPPPLPRPSRPLPARDPFAPLAAVAPLDGAPPRDPFAAPPGPAPLPDPFAAAGVTGPAGEPARDPFAPGEAAGRRAPASDGTEVSALLGLSAPPAVADDGLALEEPTTAAHAGPGGDPRDLAAANPAEDEPLEVARPQGEQRPPPSDATAAAALSGVEPVAAAAAPPVIVAPARAAPPAIPPAPAPAGAARARRGRTRAASAAWGAASLALLVAMAAAMYAGSRGALGPRGAGAAAAPALVARGVSWGLYDTESGPPVVVVRGEVAAERGSDGPIRVAVELRRDGAALAATSALAGASAGPEDVWRAGSPEGAASLRRALDGKAARRLAPGARAPFLVTVAAPDRLDGVELFVSAAPAR